MNRLFQFLTSSAQEQQGGLDAGLRGRDLGHLSRVGNGRFA